VIESDPARIREHDPFQGGIDLPTIYRTFPTCYDIAPRFTKRGIRQEGERRNACATPGPNGRIAGTTGKGMGPRGDRASGGHREMFADFHYRILLAKAEPVRNIHTV